MTTTVLATSRTTAGLATELRVSLMRLSRRLRNERDPEQDPTANQLSVLFTLNRMGSLTVGDLAAEERVQPPSMTRTVNILVGMGLVNRAGVEGDRRVALVSLTAEGSQMIEMSRKRKEAWLSQRLGELTPAQRQTLREAAPILDQLSRV